jgi:TPR repeat protein
VFSAAGLFLAFPLTAEPKNSSQEAPPAQQASVPLSAPEMADIKTKAGAGDAMSQMKLGKAYLKGVGVPRNEELAFQWMRKAADQGNAAAENDLGTMYRIGQGVALDKEEAARWYQKAARHGSAEGMFNLGTCHYNGDGVGSNEYTAYVWFLLAQEAGDATADDAVKRSASTMRESDNGDAYVKIADMYGKGDEIPKDDAKRLQWLRRAAKLGPTGQVLLAGQLIKDSASNYPEAFELCKAAAGNAALYRVPLPQRTGCRQGSGRGREMVSKGGLD